MSLRSRQPPGAARTSLLGYDVAPGSFGPRAGTGSRTVSSDELLLQRHSEQSVGELERQVGAIKHITLEIESELQNSNRMLDEMNFTMDSTRALLESAMKRLEQVTATAGSRHMVYLFLFCFFVFGLLYYLIR